MLKRGLLVAGLSLSAALLLAQPSQATPPSASVTGVSVNPDIVNLVLQPTQTTSNFTVNLENDSSNLVAVIPTANDFSTVGSGNTIKLLPKGDPLHGLMSNLAFSAKQINLAPGTSQTLTVGVRAPQQLSPGGHYAVIRYNLISAAGGGSGQVGLDANLSTFVFLATSGKSTYGVSLQDDLPKLAIWKLPQNTDLLFTNTANTQTAPLGYINIESPGHQQIVNTIINQNSQLVLPGSTRLYHTPIKLLKPAFWPGRYRIDIYYRADEAVAFQTDQQSLVYVGKAFILCVIGLIIMLLILVRFGFKRWRRKRKAKQNPPPEPPARSIPVEQL